MPTSRVGAPSPSASRPWLVVLSDADPVGRSVAAGWGTAEPTGEHVEGASVRRVGDHLLSLRRPGPHLHDERLDLRLPPGLADRRPTLVFPSIHRSESGTRCFTVHPLGNLGGRADHGGRPRTVVPTDPEGMAALLRELAVDAPALGLTVTYEATHHGPELGCPAYFAEVAVPEGAEPAEAEVARLAKAIRDASVDPGDRVALAVGGGHYAPRFTDLALRRRWAFGHIISRHAFADLEPATVRAALTATPGARGALYAKAEDRGHPTFAGIGPPLRETEAERREARRPTPSGPSPRTSGT